MTPACCRSTSSAWTMCSSPRSAMAAALSRILACWASGLGQSRLTGHTISFTPPPRRLSADYVRNSIIARMIGTIKQSRNIGWRLCGEDSALTAHPRTKTCMLSRVVIWSLLHHRAPIGGTAAYVGMGRMQDERACPGLPLRDGESVRVLECCRRASPIELRGACDCDRRLCAAWHLGGEASCRRPADHQHGECTPRGSEPGDSLPGAAVPGARLQAVAGRPHSPGLSTDSHQHLRRLSVDRSCST